MPCPGPFHFSHSVHYIYDFCPLPDPDVGPSIFVCDVEHTSFHFGMFLSHIINDIMYIASMFCKIFSKRVILTFLTVDVCRAR